MPGTKQEAPNARAVAAAAGVSLMTVSRALRNTSRISKETRRRVLTAARRIGYVPNPQIARLMSMVRGAKSRQLQAVIAVVRDNIHYDSLHDPIYKYVALDDIRPRAERYGYQVEEFFLGGKGLLPARLASILHARYIEGVIVSPQSTENIGARMDFSKVASATFGFGLRSPAIHRAASNMMDGILIATSQLVQRGYRRIGMAITPWINARADNMYSGGFLHFQQTISPSDRVPILYFPHNSPADGKEKFSAWVRKFRPDVVISFHSYVPEWLTKSLGRRIPEDIGLVVHDWTESMEGFAGIYQRRPSLAAAAVDLIATQLMQNERGIPEVERQILIRPLWIEGPSIRPHPSGAPS